MLRKALGLKLEFFPYDACIDQIDFIGLKLKWATDFYLSRDARKPVFGVSEKLYYPCSENKGADQLRGYREADLRLCFRLGKNPVFSRCGSFVLCTIIKTTTICLFDSKTLKSD